MKKFTLAMSAAIGAMALVPAASSAQIVTTVSQVGANVVASTTGSISLAGLTNAGNYTLSLGMGGVDAYVSGGTSGAAMIGYSGFTGVTSFGAGNYTAASSGAGANYAFNGGDFVSPYLFLSSTYTSGSSIVSSSTYNNTTISALGLNSGSYVWRAASGATVTVNIGATAAVPEPATWALMLAGFGAVGFAMRRRVRQSNVEFDARIKQISEGVAA